MTGLTVLANLTVGSDTEGADRGGRQTQRAKGKRAMREIEIIERYEKEYDPDTGTVDEFVQKLGVSRQRLYNVLQKHGVVPKTRRGVRRGGSVAGLDDELTERMAEMALGFLVNQLHEARVELAKYRELYGPLDDDAP